MSPIGRLEALEPRLMAYSCPRGATGRLHTLRLRRHFRAQLAVTKLTRRGLHQPTSEPRDTRPNKGFKGTWSGVFKEPGNPTGEDLGPTDAPRPDLLADNSFGAVDGGAHLPGLDTNLKQRLEDALISQDRQMLLQTAMAMVLDTSDGNAWYVLKTLPPTTFSELLRSLDPEYFLGRYMKLFQEMSIRQMSKVNAVDEVTYEATAAKQFLKSLVDIVMARQRGPFPLALRDFKHLLRCARIAGNGDMAEKIWNLLQQSPQTPDVECYNEYLGALCAADLSHPIKRQSLHTNPRHVLSHRASRMRDPTSAWGLRRNWHSLKLKAMSILNSMMVSGITPNEETFCLVMISMGREGDIEDVTATLNRTWGIDVDAIRKADGSGHDPVPPKQVPKTSAMHPTGKLLFAVAHVFGINNQVPLAMRLVDYISRHFDLSIPSDVWAELFERTFVQAHPARFKRRRMGERKVQALPKASVRSLWQAMTTSPYNLKPNIALYDRLIRNLGLSESYGEMQARMEEATELVEADRAAFATVQQELKRHMGKSSVVVSTPNPVNVLAADARYLKLRVQQSEHYVAGWTRGLLVASKNMLGNSNFGAVNIPHVVGRWGKYLPRVVEYRLPTGDVEIRRWSDPLDTADANEADETEGYMDDDPDI